VIDEGELIRSAQQGDGAALEALALAYAPRVFRFGLKMCRNEDDAGDVAQQTMLSMASKLRDFRGESRFATWLFAVARSHCIKHRTRGAAAAPTEPLDQRGHAVAAPSTAAPDEQLARRELEVALDSAISALDPAQREVLLLRDVEGLPAAEVAAVLELSVEAVKSRLHRARKSLRDALAPFAEPAAASSSCPDVVELLSRYQEGDVSAEACRTMEAHVDGCAACARRCQSLRRVLTACSNAPTPTLPDALKRRVSEQIRRSLAKQTS
jgi:RNA polymerase sigma-70 factor, ECF subfamily